MARLRYNGLTAALGADLTAAATAVTFSAALAYAGGVAVPTISGSDYIPLAILDASGRVSEIVRLTAYTSGATTGTISRGHEGTTAVAHLTNDSLVNAATTRDFTTRDINNQTGTAYTLALGDAGAWVRLNNAAAITLTIPANSSVAFPVNTFIEGNQAGAGQVTIVGAAGVTVNATPGLKVAAQYGTFGLLKVDTDTWLAYGRLSA